MIYLRHLGKQGLIGKYPNGMKEESEVCGKIPACRPQRIATTLLPAVSLHEKSGVLGDSGICRILPSTASGSAGKYQDRPSSALFRLPRPAVLSAKIGLRSEASEFSPHFRNTRPCKACSSNISSICGNIQLSQKRQRAVVGKPNNDPSLSPPHVESTATASLRTSYRNVKQPNKATINNAAVRP